MFGGLIGAMVDWAWWFSLFDLEMLCWKVLSADHEKIKIKTPPTTPHNQSINQSTLLNSHTKCQSFQISLPSPYFPLILNPLPRLGQ